MYQRSEVFVKIKKKYFLGGGGRSRFRGGGGVEVGQGGCERKLIFCENSKNLGGGGQVGRGWVRFDVNEELKFL